MKTKLTKKIGIALLILVFGVIMYFSFYLSYSLWKILPLWLFIGLWTFDLSAGVFFFVKFVK
jgi:hypothetical protein